jgi:glycosyltransferase involved in cell wall biosynthesis/GT2 family glycosyltransferase
VNRTLRIGVDVRSLEVESSLRRGIGRYVINLLRAMTRLAPHHQFRLYGDNPPWETPHLADWSAHAHVRYATYHPSFARDLNVLLLTDPAPVMVGRPLVPYPLDGLPCATIFYDLIPLAFEQEYLSGYRRLQREYRQRLNELLGTASLFLTISQFVADDLKARLQVPDEKIRPILGGLDACFRDVPEPHETASVLRKLGVRESYFFYTGGADYRKNVVNLLSAFSILRAQVGRTVKLALAGEFSEEWRRKLSKTRLGAELERDLLLLGHVSDSDLRCLYAGALAFVFPSFYEGFGLPAIEAMACGSPVIASDGSSLREIVADAGLLVNPQEPSEIASAMLRMVREPALAADLRERGLKRAAQFRWQDVAHKTLDALQAIARTPHKVAAPTRRLRVLIQNRPEALAAPGGDTVVMRELYGSLRARDVEVDVAAGSANLKGVDLVHLLNLTVSQVAGEVAGNARGQHVPYVVTTLFEDWPRFMDKAAATLSLFREYIRSGKNLRLFDEGLRALRNMPPGPRAGRDDVVRHAAGLFVCGESEARLLAEAFPGAADRTHVIKFGVRLPRQAEDDEKALVRQWLGFDRYLICCGRLETRKNQLMLLKALEDSDVPLVLASSGFSCQPAYAQLILNYGRRAPVRIVGRIGSQLLYNLMAAASAHVLPSWFELPGLVTLEAAAAGTALVASEWGAIGDYLPLDHVHLCRPDDPDSIRAAVDQAMAHGPRPDTRSLVEQYTWESFGEATLTAYDRILAKREPRRLIPSASHTTEAIANTDQSPEVNMTSSSAREPRFEASIIIPVHNRARLTEECLEALSRVSDRTTYEVIIVDNHSTDDTGRVLQALEGDVTVLRQPENRGFGVACNQGARVASGEYLIFLNNDTRPLDGWLDALMDCARQDSAVSAVGSKLLYPDGTVQHAGVAFNCNRVPYHVFQNFAADDPAVNEERDMQAVTGACMLVRAAMFTDLGGFDENYVNGFEDIDLCLRLRERAKRVVYCPRSVVIHHEESSDRRKEHDGKNLERFLTRWSDAVRVDDTELVTRHGYEVRWESGIGRYSRLTDIRQLEKPKPAAKTAATLDEARALYEEGEFEKAAAALQSIVESRLVLAGDDTFETWQTLGNCLARMNRVEEAERAYCEAIKLDEKSERPYLGLGSLALLQENWQAAMYGFMTALAKNPEAVKGEFGVGLSMAARNMHNEAIDRFQRVLTREPYNGEALFYLYRSAMETNRPRVAIDPIERYLERNPNDVDFLFNLCGAYWKAGEIARAADLCQQVLKLNPDHAAAKDVMRHLKSSLAVHA